MHATWNLQVSLCPAAKHHHTLAGTHLQSGWGRRLSWPGWLVTCWRRVTLLVRPTSLLLRQTAMTLGVDDRAWCTPRGAGDTPFSTFSHLFPLTSSSFAFFYFFPFSFSRPLYLFSSFVHPAPFYQNSHHSISRLEVVGGDQTWV